MWFHSRQTAAYDALCNLYTKLPAVPDNNQKEWGTVIYKVPFDDGTWGYCYQVPYISSIEREWSPNGNHMYAEYGGKPVGYCHTHPVLEGFSDKDLKFVDVDPALNKKGSVAYMVNLDGAYWYDGRLSSGSKTSRMGKFWGKWWTKD